MPRPEAGRAWGADRDHVSPEQEGRCGGRCTDAGGPCQALQSSRKTVGTMGARGPPGCTDSPPVPTGRGGVCPLKAPAGTREGVGGCEQSGARLPIPQKGRYMSTPTAAYQRVASLPTCKVNRIICLVSFTF